MECRAKWVMTRTGRVTNNLAAPEVRVEYNSESYQKNSGFEMEWNFNRLIINKFFL